MLNYFVDLLRDVLDKYCNIFRRYSMSNTDVSELLMVCESTSQLWPVNLYNAYTGSSAWSYKGSELQSECLSDVAIVAGEFIILSVAKKSLVYTVGLGTKNTRITERSILPSPLQCLAVSSDGWLCCGAVAEKLYTWTLNGGQLHSVVSSHYQPIVKINFTSDNSYVVSAGKDGSIVCYNVADLLMPQDDVIVKAKPIYKWSCHSLPITDLKIGNGGIGGRVYTVSMDQTAKVHSLASGELLMTLFFDCQLASCAIDNAETRLFIGTVKGDIRRIDMFVEPVVREQHIDLVLDFDDKLFKGHKQSITSLSVNIDGNVLASASDDCEIKIWHIISRQCIRTINCKGRPLKAQFISTPPAIGDQSYTHKTVVHSLQKNVANKCEEVVFVRLRDRSDERATERNVEVLLDQLTEEESLDTNDPGNLESLRNELAKAKQLNKNLYQFCVDKIISGT